MQVLFKADYDQDINYLVNRGERIRIFGVVALALVAPFFVSGFYLSELSIFLVYILAGLGLMVLIGFTGVVSFGHAAFLDIGAYTNSVLLGYDVPFFVSLPLAALLAGVIGAALGRAASKMHGFYMTIATPAFAIVVETAIGAWEPVTGGHMGLSLPTMREKDFGIWRAYSWEDYAKFAYDCAGGFLSLGLCRGDVVSILSENNKEWAWADMAAHCAGLTVNGVYPTYQAGQLEHMLNDSRTRVLIVENEEQLDKFLTVREKTPHVLRVYVIDWKSLRGFTDPMVAPIEDLYETGAAYRSANPAAIDAAVDGGKNGDATVLIYTSCTTGAPKGALISNRYLLFQMSAAPDTFPITADDDILTYLPLCHAAERVISLCMNLGHGTRINFA